jgi:hypothetical protein
MYGIDSTTVPYYTAIALHVAVGRSAGCRASAVSWLQQRSNQRCLLALYVLQANLLHKQPCINLSTFLSYLHFATWAVLVSVFGCACAQHVWVLAQACCLCYACICCATCCRVHMHPIDCLVYVRQVTCPYVLPCYNGAPAAAALPGVPALSQHGHRQHSSHGSAWLSLLSMLALLSLVLLLLPPVV